MERDEERERGGVGLEATTTTRERKIKNKRNKRNQSYEEYWFKIWKGDKFNEVIITSKNHYGTHNVKIW